MKASATCLFTGLAVAWLTFAPAVRAQTTGTLTTLYGFSTANNFDGSFGGAPAALVLGSDGNFYGTNSGGSDAGTVFSITPAGVLTTLYHFSTPDETTNQNANGAFPYAALVQGKDGNFYGTTNRGGNGTEGTVFSITPAGVLTTLHTFSALDDYGPNGDGAHPRAGLVQGSDGNFYGTTSTGGINDFGTVFSITPTGVLTVLHSFAGDDGLVPNAALVQGKDGSFYGTTEDFNSDFGTVFSVTPAGVHTLLYSFTDGTDGEYPSGLVQGSDGGFYGVTADGPDNGAVFRLTVGAGPAHPAFFMGQTALERGVYYLAFPDGNPFGYYSFLPDPQYIYHFDLGFEYVSDANDGAAGVYFYDFASSTFFYSSPTFPFPYLYDFTLDSVLYYFPDPNNAGHYNTGGVRYFYEFKTGQIISK